MSARSFQIRPDRLGRGRAARLLRQRPRAPMARTSDFCRRTTCCQMLRSSSILTGLIRKSQAPWVTPRSTVVCSPLDDITAGGAAGRVVVRERGGGLRGVAPPCLEAPLAGEPRGPTLAVEGGEGAAGVVLQGVGSRPGGDAAEPRDAPGSRPAPLLRELRRRGGGAAPSAAQPPPPLPTVAQRHCACRWQLPAP
jgi:hypothetical protein